MEIKFSPSVNIIRDSNKELNYTVTPNAETIARQIANDFKKGFHSFNVIGSYGTGKSSFLWALSQTLERKKKHFDINLVAQRGKVKVLNFVGEYQSLINTFIEQLGVKKNSAGNQEILDAIYQQWEKAGTKDGLLIIFIDELGKFLEYASKHQPEKELYFIQQLSEFVNDKNRNILFISTLHQSFESYSSILNEGQKKEWSKVKGRLKELSFNEPVEQLLLLAGDYFSKKGKKGADAKSLNDFITLNSKARILSLAKDFPNRIGKNIYPLEPFSAYALTLALQQYGQNERSLFTFLESSDDHGINQWDKKKSPHFSVANVYDYLFYNFYSYLHSKNPHFSQWAAIKSAIERAEVVVERNLIDALQLIKVIGLLNLFGSKGGRIDHYFLKQYCKLSLGIDNVSKTIDDLVKYKIIRFNKFSQSFKIFEGTDLDIDAALLQAGSKVDEVVDVVGALKPYFDKTFFTAKSVSYVTGTPRNFQVIISEEPCTEKPKGEVDGFINLIFGDNINARELTTISDRTEEAILYGYYRNLDQIKNELFEIQKAEKVLKENQDDLVAKKYLKDILKDHQDLLSHYVIDGFYSPGKITWAFQGEVCQINNKRDFNRLLSEICEDVYTETPTFRNELLNKHKIHGTIHNSRKLFFEALVKNWDKQDLGFQENEFPPEKTIYLTLLEENKIHCKVNDSYELREPSNRSTFRAVWQECERFLERSKQQKTKITELIDLLGSRPYKLKQGLIDFLVPTFLFIRRGDFALYEEGNFTPYINESILYLITRNPQHYEIKAFEIKGIRLKLFNKYREFLQQGKKSKLTNEAFIESIRPFLVFYKQLPDYCKRTQKISEEARALRTAIINAQDPEKVFFEEFPSALKLNIDKLSNSERALAEFANKLNSTIEEIKSGYAELVNRIDIFIQDEILAKDCDFDEYKNELQKRFVTIKEHKLTSKQRTFLQRLNSPLDDRDSWIASISQAILQKPLEQIVDSEEDVLKESLLHSIKELDNLREIHKEQKTGNEIIKFDLTTVDGGLKTKIIEIPKGKSKDIEATIAEIRKQLKSKENISIAVLAKLLNEKLYYDKD